MKNIGFETLMLNRFFRCLCKEWISLRIFHFANIKPFEKIKEGKYNYTNARSNSYILESHHNYCNNYRKSN